MEVTLYPQQTIKQVEAFYESPQDIYDYLHKVREEKGEETFLNRTKALKNFIISEITANALLESMGECTQLQAERGLYFAQAVSQVITNQTRRVDSESWSNASTRADTIGDLLIPRIESRIQEINENNPNSITLLADWIERVQINRDKLEIPTTAPPRDKMPDIEYVLTHITTPIRASVFVISAAYNFAYMHLGDKDTSREAVWNSIPAVHYMASQNMPWGVAFTQKAFVGSPAEESAPLIFDPEFFEFDHSTNQIVMTKRDGIDLPDLYTTHYESYQKIISQSQEGVQEKTARCPVAILKLRDLPLGLGRNLFELGANNICNADGQMTVKEIDSIYLLTAFTLAFTK